MYFWNTQGLAHYVSGSNLRISDFIVYVTLLFFILATGFGVPTLLPKLYYLVFSCAKNYLEIQVKPAPLEVVVYTNMDDFFLLINLVIVTAGLFFCFLIHKGTFREFIGRSVALSWPIMFRLIVITSILFAIIVGLIGLYFLYKLLLISKMEAPKGPVLLRPLKYILKATGTYSTAKLLWIQAHALPKAQIIFDKINNVSFYTYWVCQLGSVFSTMWWMLTLQENIRLINKNNNLKKNFQ
jgi:hypothetical protein